MDPVLLIFVVLAAFVIFRLLSVLGTRTGHEQHQDIEGLQRASQQKTAAIDRDLESEREGLGDEPNEARESAPAASAVSAAAEPLRAADPSFDEGEFLAGARAAYEMIVEAFAAGDLKSVKPFLAPAVFETFNSAASQRSNAGHEVELKFVGIETATIARSELRENMLYAVTEFASNQVRATRDRDGAVIDGDPNRIDLVKDRWTFARKLTAKDPNWMLVATTGA